MELENQLVNCLYKMNSLVMSAFGCLKWFSSSSCMNFFFKENTVFFMSTFSSQQSSVVAGEQLILLLKSKYICWEVVLM